MINVKYNRKDLHITVTGHAYSGEPGHDLICAAASILAHTIADIVSSMEGDGYCNTACVRLDKGDAEISCVPAPDYRDTVLIAMDSVMTGFGILASNYPGNVSFTCDDI